MTQLAEENLVADPNLDPQTWVDQYGDYLYRFALARIKDQAAAEDLVQETFLAALQVSATNSWVMLYRARMFLRRCLELDWFNKIKEVNR